MSNKVETVAEKCIEMCRAEKFTIQEMHDLEMCISARTREQEDRALKELQSSVAELN